MAVNAAQATHTPASRNQRSHSLLMMRKGKKNGSSTISMYAEDKRRFLAVNAKVPPTLSRFTAEKSASAP